MSALMLSLNTVVFNCTALYAILFCLILAVLFVGSLYVKVDKKLGRDHPEKIKERFVRVSVVCLFAVPLFWLSSTTALSSESRDIWTWLGLRMSGFFVATILPLMLTMILFLGPLTLHYLDGVLRLYADRNYWSRNLRNLVWIRNHIMGPLSEEFVFRACMLPVLVPSFGESYSVLLCPVFFGVAHLHHMYEKVREGMTFKNAALVSGIQFGYTTVFGIYSAFLFLRTGHFTAPLIAHAFCNHMGFPHFDEVLNHPAPKRYYAAGSFVVGLFLWMVLLFPLTEPSLYNNTLYYKR